jgi:hypothetical protein
MAFLKNLKKKSPGRIRTWDQQPRAQRASLCNRVGVVYCVMSGGGGGEVSIAGCHTVMEPG